MINMKVIYGNDTATNVTDAVGTFPYLLTFRARKFNALRSFFQVVLVPLEAE